MDNKGINWKQFLVTLLGTSIGVALTFTLNGVRESHKKERAQRLTAVMVIHDIDNTVEALKIIKKQEELRSTQVLLWQDKPDSLMTAPFDTVYSVLRWLINTGQDYRFDDSKERIFHSSQDSWQNLGNIKFIDNMQSFYYSRRDLQNYMNKDDMFVYPVSEKEYRQYFYDQPYETRETYEAMVRDYLKKQLADKQVRYFVDAASSRINFYSQHIDAWTRMNNENKFLMGITDQEMNAYIHSITQTGVPVTAKEMLGIWKMERAADHTQAYYEFRRDSLFSYVISRTSPWITSLWSGNLTTSIKIDGKWFLRGDSLIMVSDSQSTVLDFDLSEMVPVEGMKDSLDAVIGRYREESRQGYIQEIEARPRRANKVRMDASYDKIEWTGPDGRVLYSTRMK